MNSHQLLAIIVRSGPLMFWLSVIGLVYFMSLPWMLGGAFDISEARELVADVRLAMKRADLTLDYVARCTNVPFQRLSDQLNGKTPFTSFWRFIAPEIKHSAFWSEFFAIRAEREGGVYVQGKLAALVRGVEQLVEQKERAS